MGRDPSALITEIKKDLVKFKTNIPEERCIYKVHEQLCDVSEKAYKPVLLAIGPYHDQDKVGQGFMKEHKLRYLQQMIKETKVETYIMALISLVEKARKYYLDCNSQTSESDDGFVKMMLLDGCFIIKLFQKYQKYKDTNGAAHRDDPIFQMKWVLSRIARDLLLFENQLPFFVLAKLFEVSESNVGSSTSTYPSSRTRLTDLALSFFSGGNIPFRWNHVDATNYNSKEKIENLLCLTHKALTFSLLGMVTKRLALGFRFKNDNFEHLLGLIHASISISILDTAINNALELHEEEEKAKIFLKHPFCLISEAVVRLLAKIKNRRNPDPEAFIRLFEEHPMALATVSEDNMPKTDQDRKMELIRSELEKAEVESQMAEEFVKNFKEIKRWKDEIEAPCVASELFEAGIEFKKAKKVADLLERDREDQKSIPYRKFLREAGVEIKKAIKFMDLLALKEIECMNIHSATELEEAGIEFKKSAIDKKSKEENMFCIKFNKAEGKMEVSPSSIEDQTETCFRNLIAYEQYKAKGKMEVSPLSIKDQTETRFRNLIAYEQCDGDKDFNYVTDYVCFMDSLIDSPKDVQLLRKRGIIRNYLGDDEVTAKMVNKLCHNINLSDSIYERTSKNMNMHCRKRRNLWKAKLRHDYFNTPWAWISFLAAALLLLLTIVQTVFSII